jgi:hypothetical protein
MNMFTTRMTTHASSYTDIEYNKISNTLTPWSGEEIIQKTSDTLYSTQLTFFLFFSAFIALCLVVFAGAFMITKGQLSLKNCLETLSHPHKKIFSIMNLFILTSGILAYRQSLINNQKSLKEIFGDPLLQEFDNI